MRGGGGCASACEFLGPVLPLFMSATYDDSPEHRCRYTIEICSRDVSGSSKGTHLATSALLLSLSLSLSFSLSRFSARNRGSRSEFTKRGRREGEGKSGGTASEVRLIALLSLVDSRPILRESRAPEGPRFVTCDRILSHPRAPISSASQAHSLPVVNAGENPTRDLSHGGYSSSK